MSNGNIVWNSINSNDLGLVIERVPDLNRPQRKFQTYEVPGRNGLIIEQQDAWDNITRKYKIWFSDIDNSNAVYKSKQVSNWLYAVKGYGRLKDSFETDCYRLAYFNGPLDIENHMLTYGMCEISFICRPERFTNAGYEWVQNVASINNPTVYNSKPLIKVEGSGNCNFTINNQTVRINGLTDYVYIDCDSMNCYRQPNENKNSMMVGDFPVIEPGTNTITQSLGIAALRIRPNFWTL